MNPYEAFGRVAEVVKNPVIIGARHSFQDEDQRIVQKCNVDDVITKLRPLSSSRLLDIGCGVGFLLTPLSRYIQEAVGIDHPSCVAKYRELGVPANVQLIAGRWPETKVEGTFDRILVYSVLQYLPDADTARTFIEECVSVLRPGGRLLLGEIPNQDLRRRFLTSEHGRRFEEKWIQRKSRLDEEHAIRDRIFAHADATSLYLTDEFVLQVLADARHQDLDSYLLPEAPGLPFCHSREDILICKRD